METLGSLFPDAPFAVLKYALDLYGGNIDRAASYLLQWSEQQPASVDNSFAAPIYPSSSSSTSTFASSASSSKSSNNAYHTIIDLTDDDSPQAPGSSSYARPEKMHVNHICHASTASATPPPSAGSSQQHKPSFEEFMAEQDRLREEEETKRREMLAARAVMKDNFVEMVQAQFPGISTKFVVKLMEQKKLQTVSDEAMLDLCVEDILKLNGRYPMAKRKAVDGEDDDDDDANEDSYAGGSSNQKDDDSCSSSDEESDLEELLKRTKEPSQERDLRDITIKMKPEYESSSATQIFRDFPNLAHKPIRDALMKHNYHYVPTYFYLDNLWTGLIDLPETQRRGVTIKTPRKKGKFTVKKDPAFRRERKWLKRKLAKDMADINKAEREAENLRDYTARGELMTCGCCYDDEIPANRVTTCGDGHVFCLECGRKAAENVIGMSRTELKCLTPDCTSMFSDGEAKRFLSKHVFDRLMRIRQQKELEKAGIDSLVECPFCPYAAIVENENDKEFRCESPKCRAVSCRLCRAITHIPLTCEEYAKQRDEDHVLAAQHRAEEEMSKALIRECTKCKTRFFKEEGCNKMTCPTCMTVTCYLCKREIRNGYAHFDPTPANSPPGNPSLCRLWEDTKARHEREIREAKEKAIDQLQQENPHVIDKLRLDVPEPPPAAKRSKRRR
ncbi:hypothetical protein BGZ73_001246 [Actinomortierella ambigua]|nr:hypothetical protein BGZ73_001246 [Actinomortierella ambigua]